jgi:hypothetical protein
VSTSAVLTLELTGWQPGLAPDASSSIAHAIEDGSVIVLPHVRFELTTAECRFLSPRWSSGRRKNISLDGTSLHAAAGSAADRAELAAMIARYAAQASALVTTLFPRYAPHVESARTSFRPQPAVGRKGSWRKDDARLHVDAFPSRPTGGARILRVFHNPNRHEDRVWRVGEPFETTARTLLPRVRLQWPGEAALLSALSVTKKPRSQYDHLMLGLHDAAKADLAYQRECAQETVRFAPGTTWLCFSDQVMHAAASGQYMLEQTIHVPVSAMYDPSLSPLAILERLTGRQLVPAR